MATVTLIRHATVVIELAGQRVLVDPMLDPAGRRGPVANTPEPRDNPLVGLPPDAGALLRGLTAAVVTHLHADHLDEAGAAFLADARVPVLGQPQDLATLRERGVPDVREIGGTLGAVTVTRTGGRHAADPALAEALGPVSGVVLAAGGERVHVAGDTVRVPEFERALAEHAPTTVVLNAGGARFLDSAPITLTARDVAAVAAEHPGAEVVAVHMDAINHCLDTRAVLRAELERSGVANVAVPADGSPARPL
jgi:L-ascorbate metabolism protein UlaG (beta-lactamase superfamily)